MTDSLDENTLVETHYKKNIIKLNKIIKYSKIRDLNLNLKDYCFYYVLKLMI